MKNRGRPMKLLTVELVVIIGVNYVNLSVWVLISSFKNNASKQRKNAGLNCSYQNMALRVVFDVNQVKSGSAFQKTVPLGWGVNFLFFFSRVTDSFLSWTSWYWIDFSGSGRVIKETV